MHCKQARKLLLQSVDRPMAVDDRATVRHHLDDCPECRRFAGAMHVWPVRGGEIPDAHSTDLTERVLANVRPLPPPWVYRQEQQSKQIPHLVAFAVGALGVVLTFLMLCLTFIVTLSGNTASQSGRQHQLLVPEVWADVQVWMNSIPGDMPHTVVTVVFGVAFIVFVVSWFRTLALRVGRDRQ